VIEPEGPQWRHSETGQIMGGRFDGGPTSWHADIITGPGGKDSYREFMLEFADYQLMGISEHFEFVAKRLDSVGTIPFTDHLWKAGSAVDDLWNGTWGFLRLYDKHSLVNRSLPLLELPNNRKGSTPGNKLDLVCPVNAPVRHYDVTAVTAQALPGGTLVYNSRGGLNDPTAILFVRSGDLNAAGLLKTGVPIEPLVLRAAAGDRITVTLTNALPATLPDLPGFNTMPGIVDLFDGGLWGIFRVTP
jgi:manganese oxidase